MSALSALDATDPACRSLVHATKATVGKRAFFVSAQAIQLHGGIGMTEEYPAEHYFERLLVFRALEMRGFAHPNLQLPWCIEQVSSRPQSKWPGGRQLPGSLAR